MTAAAGTGIGFATAKRCAEEGATVVIERSPRTATRRVGRRRSREQTGADPLTVVCDVTNEDAVAGLFSATVDAFGRIDVLVNNAGLGGTVNVVDMTDDQWSAVLDVTLNGTFRCTRAALQHMIPQGSGVIVNNASVIGWRAQEGQAHYAAAKAGVMALTRCSAIEAAPHGIRINAVSPSIAMHPFLAKVTTQELLDDLTTREAFRARGGALGGGERHRLPRQRLRQLHDRRSRSVSSQHP